MTFRKRQRSIPGTSKLASNVVTASESEGKWGKTWKIFLKN